MRFVNGVGATWRLLFAGAIGVSLTSAAVLSQELKRHRVLTSQEIREAIEYGEADNPQPYLLRHAPPAGLNTENPTVVAAVYTPFLRVAIASNAAGQHGRVLSMSDVKAAWLEPLVYVVARKRFGSTEADDLSPTQIRFIPPTSERSPALRLATPLLFRQESKVSVGPIWEDSAAVVLGELGADVPFEDADAVAAFPITTLVPNGIFVIYRPDRKRNDGSGDLRIGLLGLESITTWR